MALNDGFGDTPIDRAKGLVALLGWDWGDGIDALEKEDDATLREYISILEVETPNEPERVRLLSELGSRIAKDILRERSAL